MKKILLPILFVAAALIFNSCDTGNTLPEVTVTEAQDAVTLAGDVYSAALMEMSFNTGWSGFTYTSDANGLTMTFTSVDVTGDVGTYTSVSGTIVMSSDGSMVIDLSLAGGPASTVYIKADSTDTAITLEVNGYDMLSEVTFQ